MNAADLRSKSWDEFSKPDSPPLHFVFTVCDNAANEVCPLWPGQPMTAHWGIPDPAAVQGTPEEIDRAFSTAFSTLDRRISLFLCLPIATLGSFALQKGTRQHRKELENQMRFLIFGGSEAAISAALRAHEMDLRGEVKTPDCHSLAHRTEFDGIDVRRGLRATRIDSVAKTVDVHSETAGDCSFPYDKLLIGTGAGPARPRVAGSELAGVFLLHTMKHCFAVHQYLDSAKPRRVVIVGAGYIGLEMADALAHGGLEVTIASRTPTVLATVDPEFGRMVGDELERHDVTVAVDAEVHRIEKSRDRLLVTGSNNFEQECEMVLIAVGVKPNAALGEGAGLKTGRKGALLTNRRMETEIPDIYVAGGLW